MLFFLLFFLFDFLQLYAQLLLCLSVFNKYKYLREDVFHYCKLMLLNRETKLYIFKRSITLSDI